MEDTGATSADTSAITARGTLTLLSAGFFVQYLAAGTVNPLMALLARERGATLLETSVLFLTYQIVLFSTQYLLGRHADHLPRRKPQVILGLLGLGVTAVALWRVEPFWLMYPIRAVEAICFAAYSTANLALVGDVLARDPRRGRQMGLYRTWGSLAFAVGAAGGGMVADSYGVAAPFAIAAIAYVLSTLLIGKVDEQPATMGTANESPAPPVAIRSHGWVAFLVLTGVWSLTMSGVVLLWPVYMVEQGFSKGATTRLWAFAALGEAALMGVTGSLSDRFGRRALLLFGSLAMAAVYTGYFLAPTLPWILAVQAMRSAAFASFVPVSMTLVTEVVGRERRGRNAGLYETATAGGGIVGSLAGGYVAQTFGWPVLLLGSAVLLASTGVAVYARLKMKRVPTPPFGYQS